MTATTAQNTETAIRVNLGSMIEANEFIKAHKITDGEIRPQSDISNGILVLPLYMTQDAEGLQVEEIQIPETHEDMDVALEYNSDDQKETTEEDIAFLKENGFI